MVREAQGSVRVIDADNIDEMADDILAEEEADDLLEGKSSFCLPVFQGACCEGGWVGGWAWPRGRRTVCRRARHLAAGLPGMQSRASAAACRSPSCHSPLHRSPLPLPPALLSLQSCR